MKVPLLDLRAQYATIGDEIDAAMREVVESQYFILGPKVAELEEAIAAYCGTSFAVGCGSGSDALLLPMMALGIGAGDEVICPAYTFFATAGMIARLGATPVFVDIDPVTYNLDIEHTREVAEGCRNLKAIIPVDLYGQVADMDAMLTLGEDLGVPVLEDAAQAIGARDATGTPAGSCGAVGCFSFFPTKNLGGYGEGGMVTTNDAGLADQMRRLRVHGMEPKYVHHVVGLNARLDALQAAVLLVKLRHLEKWHDARRRNADRYDAMFAEAGAATSATPMDEGGLPLRTPHRPDPPARHIFNQYVIRVPESVRDDLRAHLAEHGVSTEVYYPIPLHLQECFRYLGGAEGDFPASEAAAKETLALPIYAELAEQQQAYVAETIVAFVGNGEKSKSQNVKIRRGGDVPLPS